MSRIEELYAVIDGLEPDERAALFRYLRKYVEIHPMEGQLMASAETILDALARSSDLTIRGIKGVIAEASFAAEVIPTLAGWVVLPATGEAYDFLLEDSVGRVSVQVKMQRRKDGIPLRASAVAKGWRWPESYYVVETQKTRGGKDSRGDATRPYRFGQFDIIAVSMGPSSHRWSDFRYSVSRWLLPDPLIESAIFKYQPVAPLRTHRWTDDFQEVVRWLRSGIDGRLTDPPFP